jgi:hypothetical protein
MFSEFDFSLSWAVAQLQNGTTLGTGTVAYLRICSLRTYSWLMDQSTKTK